MKEGLQGELYIASALADGVSGSNIIGLVRP